MERKIMPVKGEDKFANQNNSNAAIALEDRNPMMDRVHSALKTQLKNTRDRVKKEYLGQQEDLRNVKKRREDCGVELYGMQQQLARLQTNLDSVDANYRELGKKRKKDDKFNNELLNAYSDKNNKLDENRKHQRTSKAELEELVEIVRHAKKFNQEMKNEVAVSKRTASKADETVKGLQNEKSNQDFYIDGLNEKFKDLEGDVNLSNEQLSLQKSRTEGATKMLHETGAELEVLAIDKRQLVQQWNSSIIALARRDQALAAAAKTLKKAKDATKDHKSELFGLKREIATVRIDKENMVLTCNRFDNEGKFFDEEIEKIQVKQESTAKHFEILQKSIMKTNEEDSKADAKISKTNSEIVAVTHKIEMITSERKNIEEKVILYKDEQKSMSQGTTSIAKKEKSVASTIHEKEIEVANMQNDLARLKIDALNTQAHNSQLKDRLENENIILKEKDMRIAELETIVRKEHEGIENKMNRVDRLNRKYEQMLDGEEELEHMGPLEAAIKKIQSEGTTLDNQNQDLQKSWVTNQSKLIQQIKETEELQSKNIKANASLNILKQKRLRLFQDINLNSSALKSIESGVNGMHTDMSRLNELIGKNTQLELVLTNENGVKGMEFVHDIKELERNSHDVDKKIATVTAVKHKTLHDIVEVERQVLLWGDKIKLEKETQAALNSSEYAHETKGMEKEIHRMKNRLESIKREQEKMIREMELSIHKREDIAVKCHNTKRGQRTNGSATPMSTAEVTKKKMYLKNQLKENNIEASKITNSIEDIEKRIVERKDTLHTSKEILNVAKGKSKELQEDINNKLFERQRLLAKTDRLNKMLHKFNALQRREIELVDHRKQQFEVEKKNAIAIGKMNKIQNVISGLKMTHMDFSEVFNRVKILACDALEESDAF